ncbi:MAG TPA: pyridoxamine 5'-phosphate oxidase family protein [Verrucomicrobiae bacterium]|nr:pyridoxamine 5'-phosphate oxidase family protein [Verrucomicrobiae bacterium]
MIINELSEQECSEILLRASLGRLGCALQDQPYVIPIHLAYEANFIYVLSTFGKKIEWMRANPKVCIQVDELQGDARWVSVIANGRYQELREPQFTDERAHARKLLEKRHRWWQTAMAERQLKSGDDLIAPIFFRVQVESTTGLRAEPEPTPSSRS